VKYKQGQIKVLRGPCEVHYTMIECGLGLCLLQEKFGIFDIKMVHSGWYYLQFRCVTLLSAEPWTIA